MPDRMSTLLRSIALDESGQDLVEYALIVGVIALGAVACLSTLAQDFTYVWYAMMVKAAQYWP